jgi:hypothetical protein
MRQPASISVNRIRRVRHVLIESARFDRALDL